MTYKHIPLIQLYIHTATISNQRTERNRQIINKTLQTLNSSPTLHTPVQHPRLEKHLTKCSLLHWAKQPNTCGSGGERNKKNKVYGEYDKINHSWALRDGCRQGVDKANRNGYWRKIMNESGQGSVSQSFNVSRAVIFKNCSFSPSNIVCDWIDLSLFKNVLCIV